MKLATSVVHGGDPRQVAQQAAELESAGVDMIWVPELYGFDAVSLIGYLAAHTERAELATCILPVSSRTPTLTAMTAAGLDAVTGGRFVLGLGTSGPQVLEGWHGVPFDRPITRAREVIDICRMVWRRERVAYHGEAYTLPLPAGRGTGLGKALKIVDRPVRPDIPIYLAALGPRNVRMTAELADGWFPAFFDPDRAPGVWGDDLRAGTAARDHRRPPLEIVAGGAVGLCDEDTAAKVRAHARPTIAMYVGGMGGRGTNFYNKLFRRYGYEEAAVRIQDLYLDGRKDEAAALVPDEFLQATSLVGDEGRVRERIEAYRAAGVTCLSVHPVGAEPLAVIDRVRAWAG